MRGKLNYTVEAPFLSLIEAEEVEHLDALQTTGRPDAAW